MAHPLPLLAVALLSAAGGEAAAPAPRPDPALVLAPAELPPSTRVLRLEVAAEPARNYWLPLAEGLAFNLGLNAYARLSGPPGNEFQTTPATAWHNLTNPWVFDQDPFGTNQFQHPYQGSVYYTLARSCGLGGWTSFGYAFVGSLTWELAGETEPPSINDQITTTLGGSMLGETLFRLSRIVLDAGGARPGPWREVAAALIAPGAAVNRLWAGDRFRAADLTENPWYGELRLSGGTGTSWGDGVQGEPRGGVFSAQGHLTYGLPAGDWRPEKPLDHFDASLAVTVNQGVNTGAAFASLFLRGLVHGGAYGSGTSRGFWGLFAGYDYVSPEIFRVSASSMGIGTTGQVVAGDLGFAGTAIAGLGFGAAGSSAEVVGGRDYHFGGIARLQAEAAVTWARRVSLRGQLRQYFVSGRLSPDRGSWEDVNYLFASALLRVGGPHVLGAEYGRARRRAFYPEAPGQFSAANQAVVFYGLVSDPGMGVAGP